MKKLDVGKDMRVQGDKYPVRRIYTFSDGFRTLVTWDESTTGIKQEEVINPNGEVVGNPYGAPIIENVPETVKLEDAWLAYDREGVVRYWSSDPELLAIEKGQLYHVKHIPGETIEIEE